jgi:ribosomal protein L1
MTSDDESSAGQYFYRSLASSNRHRGRVSAYFVQRFNGSKVVARIEPLGLVHATIGDEQLAIQRLRRNLVTAGSWQSTPSQRHARIRVLPAEVVTTQKVAPQSS